MLWVMAADLAMERISWLYLLADLLLAPPRSGSNLATEFRETEQQIATILGAFYLSADILRKFFEIRPLSWQVRSADEAWMNTSVSIRQH
jgi:hypothetical protein